MPNWTKEQELAINECGKNIIVSAGAGSGKTAVLTERVIRNIKKGISIKNMLILTFTNNAAHEMKERIRDEITKEVENDNSLIDELNYLDNAYITTFDSFSLSILKKYHYLINISNDIGIIDSSIIDLKRNEILDNIFEDFYKNKNDGFIKLINLLCVKDDADLKKCILKISEKLDLLIDKNDYLDTYIEKYYDDDYINTLLDDYENVLKDNINNVASMLESLKHYITSSKYEEFNNLLTPILNATDYESIKACSGVKLGQLRNVDEEAKSIKEDINKTLDDVNNMCYYSREELINNYKSTKDIVNVIIEILKRLDELLFDFKKSINKYDFSDISLMAYNIISNNTGVREELKKLFKEICIDEYQDTNNIQEEFIKLISNNNVYMVGDIKQSIYGFRNANPTLFKEKYDNYSNNNGGIKIDLIKNFRSRRGIIDGINLIFNPLMDNSIGGAEYRETHNMEFGNLDYDTIGKTNYSNLDILNYNYDKTIGYDKKEIEAFIIAKDILDKVKTGYKVFDKKEKKLRDIKYSDIVILIDRSNDFTLYKKIFEYFKIPTSLYMDEDISKSDELYILKNIINLIIKIKENNYDDSFKYSFVSIARSYLSDYSDEEIFDIFTSNSFKDTDIYEKCLSISIDLDNIGNKELLERIINEFNLYDKLLTTSNIEYKTTIMDYLYKNFKELDSIGYGIYKLNDYLDSIVSNTDKKIKINIVDGTKNAVKIMTIHKSKGLEYSICYYSRLDKEFNMDDLKSRIIYNEKYGIIVPIFNDGLDDLFTKKIVKHNYIKENISEKIRLLYVALTRAREKMIIISNLNSNDTIYNNGIVDDSIRIKYKSFNDMFNSIYNKLDKYVINVDLNKLGLTKEYNKIKDYNLDSIIDKNNEKIVLKEFNVDKNIIKSKHFSKENNDIIDSNTKNNMIFGTYLHELFELVDLKNPEYYLLKDDEKKYIYNFLNQDINKNINNATIYKEYEFIYNKDNDKLHGIIDLMLEYDDYINIVDYKLSNTTSEEYIKQLNGYKEYIESTFNKKVNIYLYSIIRNEVTTL